MRSARGQRPSVCLVAAEDINFFNGATTDTYQPDADDHLLFKFNGEVVKDISLADFTTNGVVDWNQFRDFTVDVTGKDGMDHLEIETTGMDQYRDTSGTIPRLRWLRRRPRVVSRMDYLT